MIAQRLSQQEIAEPGVIL